MLYLSQLLNAKVTDSADKVIGRLKDIVIYPKAGEYVPFEFLAVKLKGKKNIDYIPYEYVETFSHKEISLKFLFQKIPLQRTISENFIWLKKHVLDQQIVDLEGARVVRVNDLRIGNFDGEMCVLGIDVSSKGLLRRLGLEWLDFFDLLKVHLIDWRQAQIIHGTLKLETLTQNISKLHPADLANIIEDLNINHMNKVVNSLDIQKAAYVFEKVTPELQKILIKHWGPKESSKILSRVSVKEVVDLMKTLPEEEAKIFISFLKDNRGEYVNKLINYPNDTAGGLLTIDYATTKLKSTVQQTLEVIKTTSKTLRPYVYVFVVDQNNKFYGAVSIRKLLASKPREKIYKILSNSPKTKTLHPDDDIGKIIQIMTEYELLSAPVVDKKYKLIGVVSLSDVMGHLFPPK